MATAYQVKKKAIGGYSVTYDCPHCSAGLTSSLQEAGTSQPCPTCGQQFVVPGKAEREQLRAKQQLEEHEKQLRQEQAAKERERAAQAKRVAQEEAAKQKEIDKREELKEAWRAYEQGQQELLVARRRLVLQDGDNQRQSFTLQVVLLLLAINAVLSAVFAVIAAMTVIGIPIAIGLTVNFVLSMGIYFVLSMLNNLTHSTNEAVAHLRYHSSMLCEKPDATKGGE
jgi:hypothetical protein